MIKAWDAEVLEKLPEDQKERGTFVMEMRESERRENAAKMAATDAILGESMAKRETLEAKLETEKFKTKLAEQEAEFLKRQNQSVRSVEVESNQRVTGKKRSVPDEGSDTELPAETEAKQQKAQRGYLEGEMRPHQKKSFFSLWEDTKKVKNMSPEEIWDAAEKFNTRFYNSCPTSHFVELAKHFFGNEWQGDTKTRIENKRNVVNERFKQNCIDEKAVYEIVRGEHQKDKKGERKHTTWFKSSTARANAVILGRICRKHILKDFDSVESYAASRPAAVPTAAPAAAEEEEPSEAVEPPQPPVHSEVEVETVDD